MTAEHTQSQPHTPITQDFAAQETNDLHEQDARSHRHLNQHRSAAIPGTGQPVDSRHRRKCSICRHPDREEIEQEFVNWHGVWHLAKQYHIDDHRSIYRHAAATGLIERRRANMRWALDSILECAPGKVTADSVIRAIRAHACLTDDNRWVEPASRVEFSVVPSREFQEGTVLTVPPPSAIPGVLTPEAPILDVDPDPTA